MLTVWCGEVAYAEALRWQGLLVAARQADETDDVLLLLTHPPTYTAGRNAAVEVNVTGSRPDIPLVRVDRGGDVTYHGPGQVVAYPIIRLEGTKVMRRYVTALEDALIATVGSYGVAAARRDGYPGVWVGREKIAAVGVRVTRRVSKHGVALNVDPDLSAFGGIIPCGITDGGVTSLAAQGVATSVEDVRTRLGARLAQALGRPAVPARPQDLGLWAAT